MYEDKYKHKIAHRILASFLLFFLMVDVLHVPLAMAAQLQPLSLGFSSDVKNSAAQNHIGIIAVLVEDGLMQNQARYSGLMGQYSSLTKNTLSERISRYALDAQHSQEFTKAAIITVKKDEDALDVAASLEKLYFEGDGTAGIVTKLVGIVLIGDVPLPVVNKNGNPLVSLFPYTDFEDKAYVFDSVSGDFLPNADATNLKAEIWHGVIKPPILGEEGNALLAEYLDKNHLFHAGEADFTQFSKKLFFMDFLNEFKLLDKQGFGRYLSYLDNWENFSYFRYNKKMLQSLQQDNEQSLQDGDGKDNDGDGKIDEDPENGIDDDLDGEPGSPLHGIADGIDNDNDGEIDEPDEGRFGLCDLVPNKSAKIKDCSTVGVPLMTGDFYNVKPGSKYFVADYKDNNGDGIIDEGIDEDDGDAFAGIDNDLDGLIDEDTTQDNDADHDGKVDEDPPGDKNGDGCSGECGVDEDLDSYDFDSDGYPNGYEKQYGWLTKFGNIPTDPENPFSIPLDFLISPIPFLRLVPLPAASDWIDEEPAADDDEDGKIDEDGLSDNDNDHDGRVDEDTGKSGSVDSAAMNLMPDAQTKKLIEQFATKYDSLFSKFFSNVNDWAKFTGRYNPRYPISVGNDIVYKSDVANVPSYITMKDEQVQNYIKTVNDAVDRRINGMIENSDNLFAADQLQAPVLMLKESTVSASSVLKDNTTITGGAISFINSSQNGVPPFQNEPYVNGVPFKETTSVQDCSLYRGSDGAPGSNSQMIEANHLYDGFDAANVNNVLYAGCTLINYAFPDRCFIDKATLPIFDLAASKAVTGVPESETDYRACFDFKEKTRYDTYKTEVDTYLNLLKKYNNDEAKKTVPKPGAARKPMEQIVLLDSIKLKLTLADLLSRWGQVDGIDNNQAGGVDELAEASSLYGIPVTNYKLMGEQVFSKDKTYVFNGGQNDAFKTVTLKVASVPAVNDSNAPIFLSSLTSHSEPSGETLAANYDVDDSGDLVARVDAPNSIAIDQPRFFNFKDKKGNYRKIMYPNLFAVNSVAEARTILEAKEAELQQIADDTSVSLDISGVLTGFLDKDESDNPNYKQMDDAFKWKAMNIDEKHVYVFKTYLDPDKTAYVGDTAKGYESLYFVADGNAQQMMMNFNGNIPETEEDSAFKSAENQKKPEPTAAAGASPGSSAGAGVSDPDLKYVFAGILVSMWFGEIIKWVDETSAKVDSVTSGLACNISEGEGDYYSQLIAAGDLDGDSVPDSIDQNPRSGDSDNDGVPDGAENTIQLRLSASKPVLEAGSTDSIVITAEGLSAQSLLQNSDNNTEATLVITSTGAPIADVISVNPAKLQGGKATFTLLPTDVTGFFNVTARAFGRPEITSNLLSIESTKRKIRLVSYKKDMGPIYDQGGASGFIILDENDEVIAAVDGITGLVSIKDNRFDLISLASNGNKPVRLGVREIDSGTIIASVFFVANKQKAIAIDGDEMNFDVLWKDIDGVHVKDLSGDDYGTLQISEDSEFGGGNVYLMEKGNRFGIVDKLGNVYLNPEFSIHLKQIISSSDPVIFEIKNQSGAVVFEVFIAAKYPKIRIFREDGDFSGFNFVAMATVKMRLVASDISAFVLSLSGIIAKAHAAYLPDTDGDGLTDLEEIFIKTDLNNADTDGDGYNDGSEFLNNYNPKIAGATLFTDLTPAMQGFSDVVNLIRRGILSLPTDGLFHPGDLLTREEFVRLNLGAICIQCINFDNKVKQAVDEIYGKSAFPDQDISGELKYCVEEGKNQGIISGYKGTPKTGYFLPREFISRAEAVKVILETGKTEFPQELVIKDTVEAGKPWYYNYIISAQQSGLFPKGKFLALDTLSPKDFKVWLDASIAKGSGSTFTAWISGDITRKEFAMMVSNFTNLYDCTQIDADNDGLGDNYEKYIYTTSPTNPDTDGGGVNDFIEVINGTNPLYAPDDIKEKELGYDDDKDGIPSKWEKDNGLNPYDPKDALQDPDEDGLINLEEYKHGTNPFDPDTDDGGVNDGDEVIKATDPLDSGDDYFPLIGDEGGYIVGNTVFDNYIYEQVAPSKATDFQNFYDEIPADGQSNLILKASILDDNGDTNETDSSSIINFFAADETGAFVTLSPQSVRANAGVAETEIISTVKAGIAIASAEVNGKYYPVDERPIYVVPLEPAKIEMHPLSPVIRSGGTATSVMHIELKDKNDNLVNTNLSFLTLEVLGVGKMDEALDENSEADGVQVSTVDGTYDLTVTSTLESGAITVKASYFDDTETSSVSAQSLIQSRDDIKLVIKSSNNSVVSDYVSTSDLTVEVQDNSGSTVTSFQGKVNFNLLNIELGELIGLGEIDIINGSATTTFHAFNKAGDAVISATAQGFPPAQGIVTVVPKKAVQIVPEADNDVFGTDSNLEIKGKLYDTDGNFANNDSESIVNFQLTDSSKAYGKFIGPTSVQAINGVVSINLLGNGITGPVNILATSPGMVAGTLGLHASTILKSTDLNDVTPQVLFASLLGSDFGNVFEQNYFAGWFIFAGKDNIVVDPNTFIPRLERDLGKAEVTVSLLSSPKPFGRLVTVTPNGKIILADAERVGMTLLPRNASNQPNRIVLRDLDEKKDLAEVAVIMPPQIIASVIAADANLSELPQGLYAKVINESSNYSTSASQDGISLLNKGNEVVRLQNNGDIIILDNNFSLGLDLSDDKYLQLKITDRGSDVLQIIFAVDLPANVTELNMDLPMDVFGSNYSPGTYTRMLGGNKNIGTEVAFSGNSTALPRGLFITDKTLELPSNQAPGLNYLSLEKSNDVPGIGFTGDNKHMLLFAAGNSAGESNLPYASEIGVVIGDPTVRINNKYTVSKDTGYTKDIGQEIYSGDQPIQEINPIDYNNDGLKDLFISYENGQIRLLQNNNGYPRFTDMGMALDFPDGIISMAVADFDLDGREDIVVALQDSCREGEVCVNFFKNYGGNFVRSYLDLKPFTSKNRIKMIRSYDLNNDLYPDLITSDDSGAIRVFYNFNGEIEKVGQMVGSLGISIDPNKNLKTEVLVAYDGSPVNSAGTQDDQDFVSFSVPTGISALSAEQNLALGQVLAGAGSNVTIKGTTPEAKAQKDFIYLDLSSELGLISEKRAQDLTPPNNASANGDIVQYTITLRNNSANTLNNVMVSDVVSSSTELNKNSFACIDCASAPGKIESGQSLHPFIYKIGSIPAGETRTLSYRVTVTTTPAVNFTVGKNLSSGYPADEYFDIGASPEGNPTGRMVYYYSVGKDPVSNKVLYDTYVTPTPVPPDPPASPSGINIDLNKLPLDANDDGLPDEIQNYQANQSNPQEKQKAFSKLPASIDLELDLDKQLEEEGKALDFAGDAVEAFIAAFTCTAGCIPMPINFAFFAPGSINTLGMVSGFDPGLPIFGWGVPSIIPVWPPSPYQGAVGGRIYISPTTTMSLATGICIGPYLGGVCWSFKIANLFPSSICDAIVGGLEASLAAANSVIQSVDDSASAISSDGGVQGASDPTGRGGTGGFEGSANLGQYEYKASTSTNFRIPGFPSVITNWIDRQTEEIINKLTDLPDIYFIYPDPFSLISAGIPASATEDLNKQIEKAGAPSLFPTFGGQFPTATKWTNFRQLLSYVNTIPLIQIESKDIVFKIPALTRSEIEKLQNDAQQWVRDAKAEVKRAKEIWSCNSQSQDQTICEKLVLDSNNLIAAVEKNIEILEKWKEFPRQIMEWRTMISKYAYQIICYLDAIIQYTSGYLSKQQARIEGWIDMIRQVKATIANWKALIDLMIDFQVSCDKCTTSRFTLLELIMKIFVVLPSPPVIPFPKLPDLYIDVSNIQLGLKIVWPNVTFRPEPMLLPTIPRLQIPDIPSLSILLPTIPTLPQPPSLPELPNLPPLPLPSLPDLPPPPKVPDFPISIKIVVSILKKILKIVCLIMKGLIPIPETALKTQLEELTLRGISPLLPIDLSLNLQFPPIEYNFPRRIEVISILNFQLDLDPIYEFVQGVADKWNALSTDIVDELNKKTSDAAAASSDIAAPLEAPIPTDNVSVDVSSEIRALAEIHPQLGEMAGALLASYDAMERDVSKYEQIANDVEDIHLVATQELLASNDPRLNRNVNDIKTNIALEAAPEFENQKRLVTLRNALIDYTDQQNAADITIGNGNDLNTMGRMLAQTNSLNELLPHDNDIIINSNTVAQSHMEASSKPITSVSTNGNVLQITGVGLKEYGEKVKSDVSDSIRLLADVSFTDAPGTPGMQSTATANKGIFIVNQKKQVNERLLNYTDEADSPSHLAFLDMDKDTDDDIVFSYGGNIYLKENFTKNPVRKYFGDPPEIKQLYEFVPALPAVNGFTANFNNNQRTELSWTAPKSTDVSGYDIEYKTTPDGFNQLQGSTRRVGMIILNNDVANAQVQVPTNATLYPNKVTRGYLVAENVSGDVVMDGFDRKLVIPESLNETALPGEIIHTLSDATIRVDRGGPLEAEISLPINSVFELPSNYADKVSLNIVAGVVEVINPNKKVNSQQVVEGTLIDFDTTLKSKNEGSAAVRVGDGSYLRLFAAEELYINEIDSADNPSARLNLPNGFYYAKIRAFNSEGLRGTASNITLMAPSICADKQDPFPNAGPATRDISIFKKLIIDGSDSFDAQGDIIGYWIDTNLEVDDDNDGNPTNDRNLGNDLDVNSDFDGDGNSSNDFDNSIFTLGPFTDLTQRKVKLNVMDESKNVSGQEITINVIVPEISIDDGSSRSGVISGKVIPPESEIPISILRDRLGINGKIVTASADANGKYFTDDKGEFMIDDLNLKDTFVIKNSQGDIIGEIDSETGRIILTKEGYQLEVLAAELPLLPTRIVLKDQNDLVILTMFLVPDINTDTAIDASDFPYNGPTVALFKGAHSKDIDPLDNFEWRKIPTDDPSFSGATEIIEKDTMKRVALLDTGGNFYIFDNRLSLHLREAATLADPLVIQIIFKDQNNTPTILGEFYIAVAKGSGVQFVSADKFKIFTQGKGAGPLYDSDNDGMPDQWELIYGFDINNPADASMDVDDDGLSNLEEYRALTNPLNSDSDGDGFSDSLELVYGRSPTKKAESPFEDVTVDNQYFNSILNFYQRNILAGIPSGNKLFFGPQENMSRAEFSKIMLDIFCILPRADAYAGPSIFSDVPYEQGNLPWYYAVIKEANFQGFVTGYLGEINPATGVTPFRPENPISKAEAVKVILEALEREDIIDMGIVPASTPWYMPYMNMAQDLTPYLKKESSVRKPFIITAQEAVGAENPVTRGEFIAMSDRVLTVYDCSLLDSDNDGMPDYWENKYGFNPNDASDAALDPDGDGLTNLDEYRHGTDPHNPDTDFGGTADGAEVAKATNPLNKADDPIDTDKDGLTDKAEINVFKTNPLDPDTDNGGVNDGDEVLLYATDPLNPNDDGDSDGDGLSDFEERNTYGTDPFDPDTDDGGVDDGTEVKRRTDPLFADDDLIDPRADLIEGVYVIQGECMQCPCPSAIDHTADLILGDEIFGVISNLDDSEIFSKSNTVLIESIPEKTEY